MKKKTPLWQWILLFAAVAGLIYGVVSVKQVGSHLQYVVEPEGDIAEAAAELVSLAEEWDSTMFAWTLGGFVEEASLKSDEQSGARGRITLYGENGLKVQPQYLVSGRLFYPEELTNGDAVALLDEQLALALFRTNEPIDRTFTLGGLTFRVIGVVRHTKQVGDYTDYGAYVPLTSGIQPDALVVEAEPLSGVGAGTSFSTVCSMWRGGGTLIDLAKEAMSATLWLRVLLFLIGVTLLLRFIRWLNGRVHSALELYRRCLQRKYAKQLLPQTIGVALLFILGYAMAATLALILMDFIIEPVYTFPEWVPAVLVEWEEISAAFWNVWQSSATFRELRTAELLRLRYFRMLIQICSAVVSALLCMWYVRRRSACERA